MQFFNAVAPRVYKLLTDGKQESLGEVHKINLLFHLAILGLITLAIAAVVPVLDIFIAKQYHVVKEYVALLIIVYVFQVYYVIYTVPIFFHKKTKVLPWISLIVLVIGVISNVVFIPILGIYGVCLSLFVTKLMQYLVAYGFTVHFGYNRSVYLSLPKNNVISLIVVISFVVLFAINHFQQLYPPYIINIVPLVVFGVTLFVFFRKEISSLKEIVKKLI